MLRCSVPGAAANIRTSVAGIFGSRRGTGAKRTGILTLSIHLAHWLVGRQLRGGILRKGELDGECQNTPADHQFRVTHRAYSMDPHAPLRLFDLGLT
jgi:hypothetical protein